MPPEKSKMKSSTSPMKLSDYTRDTWTPREESLWLSFVERCMKDALSDFTDAGIEESEARKRVRIAWVTFDPSINNFEIHYDKPDTDCVQVVVVHHGLKFVIQNDILMRIQGHPYFSEHFLSNPDKSYKNLVIEAIRLVDELVEDFEKDKPEDFRLDARSFSYFEYEESDPAISLLSSCCHYATSMHGKLDYRNYVNIPDWLNKGLEDDEFWRLIYEAICLGRSTAEYQLIHKEGFADIKRKIDTNYRGRHVDDFGIYLNQMVDDYVVKNNVFPSPKKLLDWIKADYSNRDDIKFPNAPGRNQGYVMNWSNFKNRIRTYKKQRKNKS